MANQYVNVPWYFRVARAWYVLFSGLRGEYFLYRLLSRLKLLDRNGCFPFYGRQIKIPLGIPETLFIHDFSLFHGLREINFANVIYRSLDSQATLADCGAAFGQVSCRIGALCPNVSSILAIEPNERHYPVLEHNLGILAQKDVRLIKAGVGAYSGAGSMVYPHGEGDSHSAFVSETKNGPVKIVTIDELLPRFSGDLALKIDVEGSELDVVNGAQHTIMNAKRICFFIEIHPGVLKRSNQTAEQILSRVSDMRHVRWTIADDPLTEIDPHAPFFSQVDERIYDVIGVSID